VASNTVNVTVTGKDKFSPEINKAKGNADGFGASLKSLGPIAVAAFAAVGAAAVGVGVGLVKVGQTFDDAFDTIRIGTGATGEALDGLRDDFRSVFATAPVDAATVASAISDLNTRLGSTGPELQSLSKNFIDFARINKVDTAGAIRDVTRLMNSMNMEAGEAPGLLDKLTRASQLSGIGVDKLANHILDAGPAFEELGFDVDKSIALFAQLEKVGARPEEVLGSLNLALNKLAREGFTNAEEAFDEYIRQIKDAPSILEATTIASELFGARVGSKVADDIRSGKFEIDEFMTSMEGFEGTLKSAVEDTDDWRQSWQLFKNQALLAVEPVATRVFELLGEGMTWLSEEGIPKLKQFGGWIEEHIIPTLSAFGEMVRRVVQTVIVPFLQQMGERVAIEFAKFQEYYERDVKPALDNIVAAVMWVVGEIEKRWPMIEATVRPVLRSIQTIINTVFEAIKRIISIALDVIRGDWESAWNNMKALVSGIVTGVKELLSGLLEAIKAMVVLFFNVAKDIGTAIVDGIVAGIKAMGSAVRDAVSSIVPSPSDIVGGIAGGIGGAVSGLNPFGGGRAAGGPVQANTPYLVGENGPELRVFGSPGHIIPNHALGGGGTTNNYDIDIHISGVITDPVATGREVARALNKAVASGGPVLVRGAMQI
jgi:TP901 family phage tail tape measure protein